MFERKSSTNFYSVEIVDLLPLIDYRISLLKETTLLKVNVGLIAKINTKLDLTFIVVDH